MNFSQYSSTEKIQLLIGAKLTSVNFHWISETLTDSYLEWSLKYLGPFFPSFLPFYPFFRSFFSFFSFLFFHFPPLHFERKFSSGQIGWGSYDWSVNSWAKNFWNGIGFVLASKLKTFCESRIFVVKHRRKYNACSLFLLVCENWAP